MRARILNLFAWGLSAVVVVIASVVWWQGYGLLWPHFSIYQIFPLFGLLAFSLMWGHYIVSVARQVVGLDRQVTTTYYEVTSWAVLLFILLHPALLAWQLWRDHLGLPPNSELRYVGRLWDFVLLGMTAWLIFLAYEFRRKFANRRWWPVVGYATDAAMVAIFIHALKLGSQLQAGWFRQVWWFYGVTLIASLVFIYYRKLRQPRDT